MWRHSTRSRDESAVSVVVPTRDRPELLRQALLALLELDPAPEEILVVDQSSGTESREIVMQFEAELLSYLPSSEKGLSRARNVGIRQAKGEVIAFIDDDCISPPDWLQQACIAKLHHPNSVAWIGDVHHGPDALSSLTELTEKGTRSITIKGRSNPWYRSPNGGNSFFMKSVLQKVGGFDEQLGQGSRFPGAEDGDILYRILKQGEAITYAPSIRIAHLPWRNDRERAENDHRHGEGFGAWAAKNWIMGDGYPFFRVFLPHLIVRCAALPWNAACGKWERVQRHGQWILGMVRGYRGWKWNSE
ncbi:MAG: glycosyltransferase [Magnetococcales bacterium]|nr:glycosyltransferase [Magnetococcales bacterium]